MKTEIIYLNDHARLETYIENTETMYRQYEKRPALIICPGGGFLLHTPQECEAAAMEFLAKGYHCFLLYYTVAADPDHPERGMCNDAAYPRQALELLKAIHIVRKHSEEWYVDADRLFLMGFSAGGHVAASAGTRWNDPELVSQLDFLTEGNELKASGMILCYPMLGNHSAAYNEWQMQENPDMLEKLNRLTWHAIYGTDYPSEIAKKAFDLINYISDATIPVFIWHSADDPMIDSSNSTRFAERLQEYRIPCEFHIFGHGGHGLALAKNDASISLWTEMAYRWMN